MDNLYGIPVKVSMLRAQYAEKDIANREVQAVREGKLDSIAPGFFSDTFPRSIIANMIDTTARDVAAVLAPLPSFTCSSTSMTSDRAKTFADKRTKITRHYLTVSKVGHQMLTAADWFNSFGMIVSEVIPDFTTKTPRILFVSPINTYPVWDAFGRTVECARVFRRSWYSLLADYPELEQVRRQYPHAIEAGNEVEVVKWVDKDRIVVYIPKMGNRFLEDVPNPMGRCTVVATRRPGPTNAIRGAYDDVVWVQFARHRLESLLIEGVDKSVRAPLVVPEDATDVALGPDAVIRTRNPQGVTRARIDMPSQAFGAVQQLEAEFRTGAMSPEARSGSIDASVITGRGVQQLQAGFSAQIAAAQIVFTEHFLTDIELCFEMDERLWGDESKDIRGNDSGVPYSTTYTPGRDISGDHTVDINYGFSAGLDPNRALVLLLQADGAGLVSKDYVRRNMPIDLNAVEEERKLFTEQLRASLVAATAGLAQSIPQLIAGGQDPTQIILKHAEIIKLVQKGVPVEDALAQALAPKPAPEAPSPDGMSPPGMPPGLPGPPEAGGLGAPPAMPEGRPPLQMLMAGMNSRGNPNLAAGVSRQIPVGA